MTSARGRPGRPEQRAALLDGVVEHVLREGVATLSLRPLAAALGTSDRMLLYYFGTRDKLLVAALAEVRRTLVPHGRFLLVDFGAPPTRVAQVLLTIGGLFDGRDNMRANLAGELPAMLASAGFDADEISRPHRGVRHLLTRARTVPAR